MSQSWCFTSRGGVVESSDFGSCGTIGLRYSFGFVVIKNSRNFCLTRPYYVASNIQGANGSVTVVGNIEGLDSKINSCAHGEL